MPALHACRLYPRKNTFAATAVHAALNGVMKGKHRRSRLTACSWDGGCSPKAALLGLSPLACRDTIHGYMCKSQPLLYSDSHKWPVTGCSRRDQSEDRDPTRILKDRLVSAMYSKGLPGTVCFVVCICIQIRVNVWVCIDGGCFRTVDLPTSDTRTSIERHLPHIYCCVRVFEEWGIAGRIKATCCMLA
jgi:hypothetical protein